MTDQTSSEQWIPGFLSGDSPVFPSDGPTYPTREAAAKAAYATSPEHNIVIANSSSGTFVIFEAKRNADGSWRFNSFPDLNRIFGKGGA